MNLSLSFKHGSLKLESRDSSTKIASIFSAAGVKKDSRLNGYIAMGASYRDIVVSAHAENINIEDSARLYNDLTINLTKEIIPRPHQKSALENWLEAGSRGTVSLPTGAGKTILAVMAIAEMKKSTLVVVPTIDLLVQWQTILEDFFGCEIGALGGGQHKIEDITVSTYDSAHLMIESIGNRFGLLVVDECHHLPAPQYQMIARAAIAPFRLGLSATVERADGKEDLIYELLGSKVYDGQISTMTEGVLSPYEVVTLSVKLTDEEREAYDYHRGVYTKFIKSKGINFSRPDGWQQFLRHVGRSPEGKTAFKSYRAQKKLAQASHSKLGEVWRLLKEHVDDKIIIFTDDNQLAYTIGRCFFLAVLTHKTKAKERKKMLQMFREGELDVLVTSKVLNEGVDVPEASVGIVVSGGGGVREHVQRLGRILRHRPGKKAVMYEIIASNTSEKYVNNRRREHNAYKRSH